jgi:hypothetical protein
MKHFKTALTSLFSVVLLPMVATAQTTSTANPAQAIGTSEQALSPDTSSFMSLDHFRVNLFSIYHGAPIQDMGSPRTIDRNGRPDKKVAINFDSTLSAAYTFTGSSYGFGIDVPFLLIPVMGEGFVIGDVGARVFDSKLVNAGPLTVSMPLSFQLPTSESSKAKGLDFATSLSPIVRYVVPQSNFTLGSFTSVKHYAGVRSGKQLKVWAQPFVMYRLSEAFALNVAYEMEWHHIKGVQGVKLTTHQDDLMLGFTWNISKKTFINPYLQVFTTDKVSLANTAVGAVLNVAML